MLGIIVLNLLSHTLICALMRWADWYNLIRDWQLSIVLVTVVGFYFLRKQLKLTEASLKQTYRPLGILYGSQHAMEGHQGNEFEVGYNNRTQDYYLSVHLKCSTNYGILRLRSFSIAHSEHRVRRMKHFLFGLHEISTEELDVQLTQGEWFRKQFNFGQSDLSNHYLYVFALYDDQADNLYGSVIGFRTAEKPAGTAFKGKDKSQHYLQFASRERSNLLKKIKYQSEKQ